MEIRLNRSCGTCTRCCEGYFSGEVNGHVFYNGRPCHYVDKGVGCTIHEERPEMCRAFKCGWLLDPRIPEWLKPELSNVIIAYPAIGDIPYMSVLESGENISASTLSWIILFALENSYNLLYEVNGGQNVIGSPEFISAYHNSIRKKDSIKYIDVV
jgi:hypothetical protein